MKKFTSILATIMLAVMSLTFVSCDDDSYIADSLWGVWEGDMYVTSQWNGNTYYSSYSVLAFDKDPYEYASGSGLGRLLQQRSMGLFCKSHHMAGEQP